MIDHEMINVIAEQLRNEFPGCKKDMYQVAKRMYNIMLLEQPTENVTMAKEILKTVLKKME